MATVIPVTLRNRTAVFHCKPEVQLQLKSFFRFRPPGFFFSPAYQAGHWDGWINLMQRGTVSSGLFLMQQPAIEKALQAQFQITDERLILPFQPLPARIRSLARPYQRDCIAAMITHSNTGGLVLNATGSGKTFMTGAYFAQLRGNALFIVDELTLLEQARRELGKVTQERIGVAGSGIFKPRRITVATIQTLHKHRERPEVAAWFQKLDVVVLDEIHLALNQRTFTVLRQIKPKAVFGLTATLELRKRHIALQAAALAGPSVFTYPIQQGVREGYLSPGIVCRINFTYANPDTGREYAMDYHSLVSHNKRRNDCIEQLVRTALHEGYRIIVLVERLAHLRILHQRLCDVPHAALSGACTKERRFAARQAMNRGRLRLILATRIFAKGIDIGPVNLIIDASAGRSANNVIQRYGRGTRKAKGKTGLIFFDIADRSPVRITHPGYNRFQEHARARARALRTLEMPVIAVTWKRDSQLILRKTAALLAQPIPTRNQLSSKGE